MSQQTISIKLQPRWWVFPLINLVAVVAHLGLWPGTEEAARKLGNFIGWRGFKVVR